MDGLSIVHLSELSPQGLNGIRATARTFLSGCKPADMHRLDVRFARVIVAVLNSELTDEALRAVVKFAGVHKMDNAVREAFYALVVALKGAAARERALAGENASLRAELGRLRAAWEVS